MDGLVENNSRDDDDNIDELEVNLRDITQHVYDKKELVYALEIKGKQVIKATNYIQ